jgi:hypothetical protein
MPSTTEKIEGISDSGVFERLGIRVLKEIDQDCRAIILLGQNAVGKTIPGPVDGFGRVPGSSPSTYVTAAFTTISLAKLEQKWLAEDDSSSGSKPPVKGKSGKAKRKRALRESGDLIKAAKNTAELREAEPDAHFIVYLCTNRRLENELLKKVLIAAARLQVEVRFLDQATLEGFLDAKPEGQWLRREHLGIAVEQLSASLLDAASKVSLKEYERSPFTLLTTVDDLVSTVQSERALGALRNQSLSLYFLVGPSGIGKSVIGLLIQRNAVQASRFALWIPAEVVHRSASLSDALDSVLHSIYPTLTPGAGLQALQIAAGGPPLLLVVDDINRLPAPQNALTKLLRWTRPMDNAPGKISSPPPVQIVCPVWDSVWTSIGPTVSQSWIGIQPIEAFLRAESLEVLRAGVRIGRLHESELDGLASELKDDPILLTLFIDTLRRTPAANPASIAGDVLNSWIGTIVTELTGKTHEPVTEYLSALDNLAAEMVTRKTLYPTVADVRSWFATDRNNLRLLLQLGEAGHLCRIASRDDIPVLEFRHDRILAFFIVNALATMVGSSGPINPAAWDPFFTLFLGEAIARRICSDAALDEVLKDNPNALIAALRYLNGANPSYMGSVKERIRGWLADKSTVPPHVWHYGISLLRDTTTGAVLEITDGLADGPVLLEARLRNGDVNAGARVLASRFWPSSGAAWLEAIIAQAVMHHGSKMIRELESLLISQDLNDGLRVGALILAGYVGSCQLIQGVRKCWESAQNKKNLALPALWAVFRCAQTEASEHIDAIMPTLFEIEHDPTGQTYSPRQSVLQNLGWAARHGFTRAALEYLVVLGKTDQYRGVVLGILIEIQDATTVPFMIRELAESQRDARQSGSLSHFAISWSDRWRDWKAQGRITDSCVNEFKRIWQDVSEPEWVRDYALKIWSTAAGDIETLRAIPREDVLHESAIYDRLVLGDPSVTADIVSVLPTKPWWLMQIPKIWSDELESVVRQHLDQHLTAPPTDDWSDGDRHLAYVLRDISLSVAERVLVEYWGKLGTRSPFVQVALYHATDKTLPLATDALQRSDKNLLKYVDDFFGFMSLGLSNRLSVKNLESLRPHLSLLDPMAVADLINFCGKHGYLQWAQTYLLPECERRRNEQSAVDSGREIAIIEHSVVRWMPSKSQLFARLDDFQTKELATAIFLLQHLSEDFSARGATLESLCAVALAWFSTNPSGRRLNLYASVIQYWGTRPNLVPLRAAYQSMGDTLISPTYRDVQFTVERRSLS